MALAESSSSPWPITELAQNALSIIVRIRDNKDLTHTRHGIISKLLNKSPKVPDKFSWQLTERTLYLIRNRTTQNSSLKDPIKQINGHLQSLEENLGTRPNILRPWHRQELDANRNELVRRLAEMILELNARQDVKVADIMKDLEDKADPHLFRYSNADLASPFSRGVEGWETTQTDVYANPLNTAVEMTLHNANGDKVRIYCVLAYGFKATCDTLAGHLSCFSRPIDDVFPFSKRFCRPGEIKLETAEGSPAPIILWAYYGVFMRMELLASRFSSTMAEATAKTPDSNNSFRELADKMYDHIKDGSVPKPEEATFPTVGKHKLLTPAVTVGKTFVVEVTADLRDFHKVICESGNLMYAKHEDTKTCRSYIFRATEAGEGIVNFCYAHHRTLNSVSERLPITISQAEKEKVTLSTLVIAANLEREGVSLA